MRYERLSGTVRRYALPVLVLALICAFLLLCRSRVQTEFPILTPEDGVLDVRGADFTNEVYHILNRWDYYPGALYGPSDFADPDSAPEKDNDAPRNNELGTWRLVILAEPETYLALCHFSIDYGTRVFVNGREVRNLGFVSADPAEAVPMLRYLTLPLYTGADGRVELIYQYSNFIHNDGGFIQNTLISTPENIDEYQRGLTLWSLLLGGGLAFFAFYFLLGAAFQKSREYAALAFCCAVIALRNQFFFGEHLLGAPFDFTLYYRLMILDVSLIPASSLYLLAAFFPRATGWRRWPLRIFTAVFAALSLCHFFVGTKSLVLLCHICYYVCVPLLLWDLVCIVRYLRKQRLSGLDALALAAVTLFIVMLIYEGMSSGSDSMINHFGVTPLTMVVCILLLDVVINTRLKTQASLLQEAEERNELLGKVNAMNRDFLRIVTHELKTPLTVISGYAQLLGRQAERQKDAGQAVERLRIIRSEADRLSDMVNRLMDYTYGNDAGTDLSPVDTDELLRGAAAVMTPVCAKRQNDLRLAGGFHGRLHGNYELLLQVLINLIVNASRHTSEGVITVGTEDAGEFAAFTVSDTGSGVAPEAVPHIFEKGYTTTEGKGLGLAICKETVELHGGTLELVSTGPEGTAFRFTIPKENEA